ncbi:MAG: molecular chaperone TorD family protein [Burkholderiaceae bacterium]|nr:molecular chaperone TorD family protein [Burkholderiaceae bacterium]
MLSDAERLLAARSDLSRLLAACFYEPGPEFAEEKMFDAIVAAAKDIAPDLGAAARRLAAAFTADDLQTLLIDYTRLFLAPEGALAQPYGSVWLTGAQPLMQESTLDVIALYAEGGFELADDFRDLPDHIAAELEFLYTLIFREVQALRQGDADVAAAVGALRRRLLTEHLGRSIPPFATAMRAGAQTAFYRELATLTALFIEREDAIT